MDNTHSNTRFICGEIVFYLHLLVFLFWIIPFFVPAAIWADRVTVHFFYIVTLVSIEIVSGILMYPVTGSFDLICPITILMQCIRGYRWHEPAAYRHSFVVEILERLQVRFQKKTITVLIIVSILMVMCQYFLGFPFV
ncbi:MAG: hypothetical protein ABII23_06460 [bacterium]